MIKFPNHFCILILLIGVLLLAGCNRAGSETPVSTLLATAPNTPSATHTPEVEPTAAVARAEMQDPSTPTATLPPAPTATLEPAAELAARMQTVLDSGEWPPVGMDPELAAAWQAFGRQDGELSREDLDTLQHFLDRWDLLKQAADKATVPEDAKVALRVEMRPDNAGKVLPLLYAVVDNPAASDDLQLFLVGRDVEGAVVGLVAAPHIDGLTQRINTDNLLVEYVDPQKERLMLRADARKLNPSRQADQVLKRRLDEVYRKNNPFVRSGLYPRFFFPVEGMGAAFYLVEESLTFQQILQMNEAFALFERPNLQPLKKAFFNASTSVVIVEQMDIAAGVTYSGTGVIELDRRDLFGNKYYLGEVLAHEGSHVLQGRMNGKGSCAQVLEREVGNGKVPSDFFAWSGDELVAAVRDHSIGAYHVSLWVLNQVGLRGREIDLLRQVIQTGQMNGQSLTPFCKD